MEGGNTVNLTIITLNHNLVLIKVQLWLIQILIMEIVMARIYNQSEEWAKFKGLKTCKMQ